MTKPLNLSFEKKFKIANICLRLNRSHPSIQRDKFWMLQFSFIILSAGIAFYCLFYSTFYHDIKNGRYADASKNCTMMVLCITIKMEYISLLKYQKSVKDFLAFIDEDYSEDNDYSEEDKETVLEYAEKGAFVSKFSLVVGVITSATFPVKAFILMSYYYWIGEFRFVAMFELTFPEPAESYKNIPLIFWTWFVITFWFDIYAATMYIGFDSLVPICLLHVCGQKQILSRRLGRLFNEYEDPKEIERELKLVIIKLQRLYKFTYTIRNCFAVIFEYNMKGTTFLIPLTAFQIIVDLRNRWINLEFITFLVASILHFLVPCYYGDLLMEKSRDFQQAIYSSGWEKCPDKRVRQIVLFMITRANVPMGIKTVFYEVNLNTFSLMVRQAYTILNLMNAAWS